MEHLLNEVAHWVLVFEKRRDTVRWWHRFVNPEFNHVYAILDNEDCCVVVNPLIWGIAVRVERAPIEDVVAYYGNGCRVLSAVVDYRGVEAVTRGPFSCVGTVKALLGLKCRAVTPEGLYRFLCQQDYVKVIIG